MSTPAPTPFDDLRRVLQTQAQQAAAAAGLSDYSFLGDPEQRSAPTGTFGQFWHRTGATKATLGGGRKGFKMTAGVWQFTLYAPEKTGTGAITRMADAIAAWFDNQDWRVEPNGSVKLSPATVDIMPQVQGGRLAVFAHGTFDYHHRNPDAPDYT